MTNQRHESSSSIPEYPVREPSIPDAHDSIELTDDSVVVYHRLDSAQWIWSDAAVERTDHR